MCRNISLTIYLIWFDFIDGRKNKSFLLFIGFQTCAISFQWRYREICSLIWMRHLLRSHFSFSADVNDPLGFILFHLAWMSFLSFAFLLEISIESNSDFNYICSVLRSCIWMIVIIGMIHVRLFDSALSFSSQAHF